MIKFKHCQCQVIRGQFRIGEIPLDCPSVWRLLASGHTVGAFQLEKKLGQDWSTKVRPSSIDEVAALTSILRPGPLESDMSQDYVDVKFGRKQANYIHPALEPILGPTHGCLIYQEQAIKIAVDIAGFSPENADGLRKAIGKKNTKLMSRLKGDFIEGAKSHGGLSSDVAEEIFGWIEKCQRYSFNKSHAVSYGMLAYQTAWAKCHFPYEFFASYLTFSTYKSNPKDEIYRLVQDARFLGIDILPPDIRRGNIEFQIVNEPVKGVAFGLGHIRGVGSSAIEKITATDDLTTWNSFLAAVPHFHRNVGVALVKSGACDCYGIPRQAMVRELEVILGTTTIDSTGKKVEVKGLTDKEREYFFQELAEGTLATNEILGQMSCPPGIKTKTMSQMLKSELVTAAVDYLDQVSATSEIVDGDSKFVYTSELERIAWLEGIRKRNKQNIKDLMIQNGYEDKASKPPCASDARRETVESKAAILQSPLKDTGMANSAAEKHFLGIALSCSPADDVNNDLATHTCLDVAKARNSEKIVVCAIIDSVKYTKTKRGKNPGQPMCFVTISDSTYSIDHAVVFPDVFCKIKNLCKDEVIGLFFGEKKNGSFIIRDIQKLI